MRAPAAIFLVLVLAGCSSPAPADRACKLALSGNVVETADLGKDCATLEASSGGGYSLRVQGSTAELQALTFRVDLGPAPATGAYSPASVASWSASALRSSKSACILSAGSTSVPQGYFALDLESVEARAGGVAHGSLDLAMNVHAPPATECGPGDTEQVTLQF
jgi:hypothetical protein